MASEGVAAAMSGQPFFCKETVIGIAIGAIGGAGGGLILSGVQCGWFGAKPQSTDVGIKKFMTSNVDYGDVTTRACSVEIDLQYCDTKQAITDGYGNQNANLSSNGQKKAGLRNHFPIHVRTLSIYEKTVAAGQVWDITEYPSE